MLEKKFSNFFLPKTRPPMSVHKKICPISQAVWPGIGNIYTNVLFYYIEVLT